MQTSDKSRLWIYQAERPFTPAEQQEIQEMISSFIGSWDAHGKRLAARAEIRYERFIIIRADENVTVASGCSIDKLSGLIRRINERFEVDLFNRFNMAYKTADGVHSCTKEEFAELVQRKAISAETLVFNNSISTEPELLSAWEIPFSQSWHQRVFS